MRALVGEPAGRRRIPLALDHLADKRLVAGFVDEIGVAAQQQRLLERGLGPEVRLLDAAVFVRFARLDDRVSRLQRARLASAYPRYPTAER
jgi:hypothetical protein